MPKGYDRYLCTGDVYRRSVYNNTHSPLFHQMDIQRLFTKQELVHKSSNADLEIFESGARASKGENEQRQLVHTPKVVNLLLGDMRETIEGVFESLLGLDLKCQWHNYYCEFARPCFTLRVLYQGEWLDILSGGVLKQEVIDREGAVDKVGWNCRIGLL
jgi:phenylalanyl-tRNA synthetase alpha chain